MLKGRQHLWFSITFLVHQAAYDKAVYTNRKEFAFKGEFIPLRVDPFKKRRQKHLERVVSHENECTPFKQSYRLKERRKTPVAQAHLFSQTYLILKISLQALSK